MMVAVVTRSSLCIQTLTTVIAFWASATGPKKSSRVKLSGESLQDLQPRLPEIWWIETEAQDVQWAQAHSPQGLCRCSAASAGELCWSPAAVPWGRPNWEQCRTPGDKWLSSRHWGQVTESPVHGCGGEIDRSGRGTGQAPAWACPADCPAPAQTPSPVCASRSVGRARWQTRRGRLSRGPAPPRSPWKEGGRLRTRRKATAQAAPASTPLATAAPAAPNQRAAVRAQPMERRAGGRGAPERGGPATRRAAILTSEEQKRWGRRRRRPSTR